MKECTTEIATIKTPHVLALYVTRSLDRVVLWVKLIFFNIKQIKAILIFFLIKN